MTEILLQTIIEKLEALEMALLKESKVSNDEFILKQMQQHFTTFQNGSQKIISQLDNNNAAFNNF